MSSLSEIDQPSPLQKLCFDVEDDFIEAMVNFAQRITDHRTSYCQEKCRILELLMDNLRQGQDPGKCPPVNHQPNHVPEHNPEMSSHPTVQNHPHSTHPGTTQCVQPHNTSPHSVGHPGPHLRGN